MCVYRRSKSSYQLANPFHLNPQAYRIYAVGHFFIYNELMNNSERFLASFNRIEKHLASLRQGRGHRGMRELIRLLKNKHKSLRVYEEDLREFSELRNAIVHRTTGQSIAEPRQETVDRIEHIARVLINPPLL